VDRVRLHAAADGVAAGAGRPDPDVVPAVGLAAHRHGRLLQVVGAGGVYAAQVGTPVVPEVARAVGVDQGRVGQSIAVGGLFDVEIGRASCREREWSAVDAG